MRNFSKHAIFTISWIKPDSKSIIHKKIRLLNYTAQTNLGTWHELRILQYEAQVLTSIEILWYIQTVQTNRLTDPE